MNRDIEIIFDRGTSDRKCDVLLRQASAFAVDCEWFQQAHWQTGQLSLVTVAADDGKIIIFDVYRCPEILIGRLKSLLEDENTVKVFHDCRGDSKILRSTGIKLRNVFDTQIAHKVIFGNGDIGFTPLCEKYQQPKNQLKDLAMFGPASISSTWMRRPLTADMLEYAAADVRPLMALYKALFRSIPTHKMAEFNRLCREATN